MKLSIRWTRLGPLFFAWIASTLLASGAGALPILSEVYYDAPGADDGQVFVELAGPVGFPLEGLIVEGVNGSNGAVGPSIELSGVIGTDGLFVLADRRSDGTTFVAEADQLANFDFQNGPDSVVLRAPSGVLDALGYGLFSEGEIFAGEGASAADASPGESVARRFADVDTDDNAADFITSGEPSPGSAPFSVVPEPGAATLMGIGLIGLVLAAPRRDRC